jgi:hypothetical protein
MEKDANSKNRYHTYLEDDLIARVDEAVKVFAREKAEKETEEGIPPSKRGRSVSRSKTIRNLVIKGLEEMGL